MKKTIIKISITIVIIVLLGGLIYYFFSDIRKNKIIANSKKIIQSADNYVIQLEQALKKRDKKIETLEKKPKVITKEILVKMPEPEKDELILSLQAENKTLREVVNDDTIIIGECKGQIETLKEQLDKTTNMLKKTQRRVCVEGLGKLGFDQEFNILVSEGAIIKGMFFNNRASFGGGISFDQRFKSGQDAIYGGSAILVLAFYF